MNELFEQAMVEALAHDIVLVLDHTQSHVLADYIDDHLDLDDYRMARGAARLTAVWAA